MGYQDGLGCHMDAEAASDSMTVSVDYTQLDQPPVRLSLVQTPAGYMVYDQHGQPWTLTPCTIELALSLMLAAREKRHAVIDDASVERATWHSVRVPDGLSERDEGGIVAENLSSGGRAQKPAEGHSRTPALNPSRSESPSNVVPIRKGA